MQRGQAGANLWRQCKICGRSCYIKKIKQRVKQTETHLWWRAPFSSSGIEPHCHHTNQGGHHPLDMLSSPKIHKIPGKMDGPCNQSRNLWAQLFKSQSVSCWQRPSPLVDGKLFKLRICILISIVVLARLFSF